MRWLMVVIALGGCSFFESKTPAGRTTSCMAGPVAPITDTVVVTLVALPYLASAIYGWTRERCPEVRASL